MPGGLGRHDRERPGGRRRRREPTRRAPDDYRLAVRREHSPGRLRPRRGPRRRRRAQRPRRDRVRGPRSPARSSSPIRPSAAGTRPPRPIAAWPRVAACSFQSPEALTLTNDTIIGNTVVGGDGGPAGPTAGSQGGGAGGRAGPTGRPPSTAAGSQQRRPGRRQPGRGRRAAQGGGIYYSSTTPPRRTLLSGVEILPTRPWAARASPRAGEGGGLWIAGVVSTTGGDITTNQAIGGAQRRARGRSPRRGQAHHRQDDHELGQHRLELRQQPLPGLSRSSRVPRTFVAPGTGMQHLSFGPKGIAPESGSALPARFGIEGDHSVRRSSFPAEPAEIGRSLAKSCVKGRPSGTIFMGWRAALGGRSDSHP